MNLEHSVSIEKHGFRGMPIHDERYDLMIGNEIAVIYVCVIYGMDSVNDNQKNKIKLRAGDSPAACLN